MIIRKRPWKRAGSSYKLKFIYSDCNWSETGIIQVSPTVQFHERVPFKGRSHLLIAPCFIHFVLLRNVFGSYADVIILSL